MPLAVAATVAVAGVATGWRVEGGQASGCSPGRPEWLACEDFEGGAEGWRSWFASSPFTECNGCRPDGSNDDGRIRLRDDANRARSGRWTLEMPAAASAGFEGASLTYRSCAGPKRPGCTLQGYDKLHFRVHVYLAPDHEYVHHFLALAGTRPDRYWDSDGNAGCRPNGVRWAGTTLDFDSQRELFFYTYYPEMKCDRGGYCSGDFARRICEQCAAKEMPCASGPECCWGNLFRPEAPVVLPRGRWVCLELMARLNSPGLADGEMAFWIDGDLALRQTGLRWRDVPDLQLNKAWLQHYISAADGRAQGRSNAIWFDDMVVSTEYIGCGDGVRPSPTVTALGPTAASTPSDVAMVVYLPAVAVDDG